MYGITWPQVRNILQTLLTAGGSFVVGKYPNLDWPTISATVVSIVGIIWSIRTGQKDVVVTDAASLKSSDGSLLLKQVVINPTAPEAHELAGATPNNVGVQKGA